MWDKDSVNLNKKRIVGYVSAKEWIKAFKATNKYLEIIGKPLFTPTTIMETEDCNYAFVIHKASLNSCGKVVFTVSTKEISLANNTSKKLIRLPEGKCNNVRFDIDDISVESAAGDGDDDDDESFNEYCLSVCARHCSGENFICPSRCNIRCPPSFFN